MKFHPIVTVILAAATSVPASFAADSFVPANCTVESWCLLKATDCFLGYVDHPQGLYQGHSQYSVVRRVVADCRDDWKMSRRVTIQGPVEAIKFTSDVETSDEKARASALSLCQIYRNDWVTAAPVCGPAAGVRADEAK